jgi:hypothetical protein
MRSNPTSTRRTLIVALFATLVLLAGCSGAQLGSQSASDATGLQSGGGADRGGGSFYDNETRVIVREADMQLEAQNFDKSVKQLRQIARDHGGFVGDRSQRSEGEWDEGSITVRVPAAKFADARDEIAELGHLEQENVRALDLTETHQDRQTRIEQLEGDEQRLAELIDEANASEADDLYEELRHVREKLRDLRSQQSSLERREALSTITVDVHEPRGKKPPKNYDSAFGFRDAFLEAFYGGLKIVKYIVVFFGYVIPVGFALIPLGAFGLGLLLAWQRIRRAIAGRFGPVRGRRATPEGEPRDRASQDTEEASEDEESE